MIGRTQYNEVAIAKSSRKALETTYKGRKEKLEKVLEIWDKANPKPKKKEEDK
jgi:hypothetical protein